MKNNVLDGQNIQGSKFLLVMAAAKRSKQINRMAKERGLPPNQVSSIKTRYIKPPTISLAEIRKEKIEFFKDDSKDPDKSDNTCVSVGQPDAQTADQPSDDTQ